MAIAHILSSSWQETGAASYTEAFDCTDGSKLIVGTGSWGSAPTGVTYNGVAMTVINSTNVGAFYRTLWYLDSPTTGSNNLVASGWGANRNVVWGATVLSGTHPGIGTIGSGGATGGSYTSSASSITITSNNSWQFSWFYLGSDGTAAELSSSDSTLRTTIGNTTNGTTGAITTDLVTAAGSNTSTVTWTTANDLQLWLTVEIIPYTDGSVTSIFYPNYDGMGGIDVTSVNKTWPNVVTTAPDFVVTGNDNGPGWAAAATSTSNQFSGLNRGMFSFNTSAIPDTNVISGTVLNLTIEEVRSNLGGDPYWDIVSATPTDVTNMVKEDFDYTKFGTTVFAQRLSSELTDENPFDWTFNEDGLAYINKTGNTILGTRSSWDTTSTFDGTWASNAQSFRECYHVEKGTTYRPKLTVIHAPEVATNLKTVNGLAKASVKSFNGLAIASVKSINSLA